ncbi:MAG: GGDEF domain-containing protein [Gammaproteobacteria bacterium]|nr:GGDEF domain-containing protein [Gammaproteobacteria bacterium]
MFQQWNGQFVTYIGVVAQTSSVLLVTLMFILLLRLADRRGWFVMWVAAWGAKSVSLVALLPFISHGRLTVPVFSAASPEWGVISVGTYLFASQLFLLFMVSGVLVYARQVTPGRPAPWLAAGIAAYTALLLLGGNNVLDMAAWLALPTAVLALYCAMLLKRLPPARRSLGTRISIGSLWLFALTWCGYFVAFNHMAVDEWHDHSGWRLWLTEYNGFVDLLLNVMLAIGMLLILLEDIIRELRSAYRELGATHAELQREAFFDPLTGALNRRAFDEGFGLEIAEAAFGTVAVIDVDSLKPVNDQYGHEAGDRMLRALVDRLQAELRPTDKLYRWGGDEFMLVLPRSDPKQVAARLRHFLDDAGRVAADGKDKVTLSASVGTAPFQGGDDLANAITAADADMYEHKRLRKGETGPSE